MQGAQYGQPGTFVLLVAHTSNNSVNAEARFTYLKTPFLTSPVESEVGVTPGSMIAVSGQSWDPEEPITLVTELTFGDSPAELADVGAGYPSQEPPLLVRSNGDGTFTTSIRVPDGLSPQSGFVVSASATSPLYGSFTAQPLVFIVLPERAPTFTASLTQGLPGTLVTLTGTNWPMGTVLVEYCRGQTQVYESTDIGCDPIASQGIGFALIQGPGSFSIEVTIPPNARPGPITLQARADGTILPNIYTLGLPFDILTPSSQTPSSQTTWQEVHPRLAQAMLVSEATLPLLALLGGGSALLLWQRRRRARAKPPN